MSDFRSQRMPSPDGLGVARNRLQRAWDAYNKALAPVLTPLTDPLARGVTFDLIGFYVAWHMHGGFDGLQRDLGMSRSAIYRRVSMFRRTFKAHPDEYVMPGLGLDVAAYWANRPYGEAPVSVEEAADSEKLADT
jgi:hypothetical protein